MKPKSKSFLVGMATAYVVLCLLLTAIVALANPTLSGTGSGPVVRTEK